MIFPDLPRAYTYTWTQTKFSVNDTTDEKTPLRESIEPRGTGKITVEEWWIKHGLAQDPAAIPTQRSRNEPIDWTSRDSIEFYVLCIGMICWIAYWYGVHQGAW